MGERGKTLLLSLVLFFCLVFAAMTLYVIANSGFTILTAIALLILTMITIGLLGAIRATPEEISEAARKREPPPPDSEKDGEGDEGSETKPE
jgi:hypothetical protein